MKKVPLKDWLKIEGNTQELLASAIDYRQSAISNMIKARRNISVVTHDNGKIELIEERKIGSNLQKSA